MKKSLILGALAALLVSPAIAADLPVKAPVMAPAVFSWTGFYVGANVGYGWGDKSWSNLVAPAGDVDGVFTKHHTDGVLGGFQAGYDRQIGQWVFGFASDIVWTGMKGSSPCLGSFGDYQATCGSKIGWLSTSTVRAGMAFGQFLPYVKGGVALADDKFTVTNIGQFGTGCCGPQADYLPTKSYRLGYVAGAGMEYAFDRAWSAFVEYNYMDFGTNREGFTPSVPNGITTNFSADIKQTVSVVKVGVNYRADFFR